MTMTAGSSIVLHRQPCICDNVWCVKCKKNSSNANGFLWRTSYSIERWLCYHCARTHVRLSPLKVQQSLFNLGENEITVRSTDIDLDPSSYTAVLWECLLYILTLLYLLQVQGTNDNSIVSKCSMAQQGYVEDNFLQAFVSKVTRRAPLIHR